MYDILGYVHPSQGAPHNGVKFSTPDMDQDLSTGNCAEFYGGGWWCIKCGIWSPTIINPVWYSLGDNGWYYMERVHLMIKLQ